LTLIGLCGMFLCRPVQAGEKPGPHLPWVANGKVTDELGRPIEGASVRVNAGCPTAFPTGATETDKEGRYTVRFGPGMSLNLQPAIVFASKPGSTERNLSRQGAFLGAYRLPRPTENHGDFSADFKSAEVFLPDRPRTVDFVLVPAANIALRIGNGMTAKPGPMRVAIVGDTMPPASNLVVQATTDEWGQITLHEVPTSYAWRFEVFPKVESTKSVRSRPFTLPKAREYEASLSLTEDPQLKTTLLKIDRFADPTGKDIRQEVLGEDPFTEAPAGADQQIRGRELLQKFVAANRYWLGEPPADVRTWSYVFHSQDGTTTPHEIPEDRDVPRAALRGIFYFPVLSYLTRPDQKDNILFRRIEETNGTLRLWYTLKKSIDVREPDGNGPASDILLEVDAKTLNPREHTAGRIHESFADFVPCADGTAAPRSIHVDGHSGKFDFRFLVYEPGLWLFTESRKNGPDGKSIVVERIEDIVINGQPAKAR